MDTIKVLLVDDHTIVRKGIRALLDANADIEVVGEAENGHEAIEKAEVLRPDIVLMDHTMPNLSGLEATRQIKKGIPEIRILILTMYTNEEFVFQSNLFIRMNQILNVVALALYDRISQLYGDGDLTDFYVF